MSNENPLTRIQKLLDEKKNREQAALKLFRPMPHQESFFRSTATKRIIRGGNRSGKSSCASAEFASAATGIPIKDSNGVEIPFRYPRNKPLVMWVIGYDLDHLSRNIYRLLFQEGMFKLIKDNETGETRAWRPWEADDMARKKEAFNAPPLIPERFVEDFAWENKAQRVFKVCRLINGTEIRAFSSMGKEPQGDQCDVVWIDEDVENDKLIMEATMRILDRGGCLFWSAFPKSKNEALKRLSREAEETNPLAPTCTETVLRMTDNPFLDQAAVKDVLAGMSDEERRSRDFGEFCEDLVAVFPTFDVRLHGLKEHEDDQDLIDKTLIQNGLEPPLDWTRYLVLDPGHARPAVLLAAVPPPHFDPKREPTIVLYDEIVKPRIDAAETARLVEEKTNGQHFEVFIIDGHAGRQTSMGRGETITQLYSAEFARRGLRSRMTGNSFVAGSDNVEAGIDFIRQYLHINADGRSRIRVVQKKCPNLCKQMELYKKTINRDVVHDKPAPNQVDDMVHCLRYLSAFNPQYRKPEIGVKQYSPAYRAFKSFFSHKKPSDKVVCGPQYS